MMELLLSAGWSWRNTWNWKL